MSRSLALAGAATWLIACAHAYVDRPMHQTFALIFAGLILTGSGWIAAIIEAS